MPSDLFTLKYLSEELNETLSGGRVQKITQPETDEIRIEFKVRGEKRVLVVSANATAPRCHLAADKKENPRTAPSFCMHLRKYLLSCELKSVGILGNDRIFAFDFEGRDELFDNKRYTLYFEQMSRYSNIVLTLENGKISDCLKRVGFDSGADRVLVPSMMYEPPKKSDKAELFEYEKIRSALTSCDNENPENAILKCVNGLSKQTAKELVFNSGLDYPYTSEKLDKLISVLTIFNDLKANSKYKPCFLNDFSDFFVCPYKSIENVGYEYTDTLNEAAEKYFLRKDNACRIYNATKNILAKTKRHREKLLKKIAFAEEKLNDCKNCDKFRLYGELLTANLYKFTKNEKSVEVENYYDDYKPVVIPLDVSKSVGQNAAAYYNSYAKLKRTKTFAKEQIQKYSTELDYVDSVIEEIARAENDDVASIKDELAALNIIGKPTTKKGEKRPAAAKPKEYGVGGFRVYVGTNNFLNNAVTFDIGRSFDLWLHVKNEHGSHVVIVKNSENEAIGEDVVQTAAEIAAYYSSARQSPNAAVDYALRKFVRRIKGAGLGMVTYRDYKTVYVTPDAHEDLLTK